MTIRTRLALGTLAIVAIMAIPLGVTLRSLERLNDSAEALRDREFAGSLLLRRIRTGIDDLRQAELALLFVRDEASRRKMEDQVTRLSAMADSLPLYALDTAAERVRAAVAEIEAAAPRQYEAALAGNTARAEQISEERFLPAIQRMEQAAGLAEQVLRERTAARVESAAQATERARTVGALMLAVALAVALTISIWLTRSISHPVRELEHGMEVVAGGSFDYALPIRPDRTDEFGRLAESFHSMAQQLAALDRIKAEFVSIASHELKTPINVILGYLQLLQEGVYGNVPEKQQQVLETLESQTQSLARLVKQLLDVSRFEAGGGRIEPRQVELAGFLSELERAFQVLAHQRGVRFLVIAHSDLPGHVTWDPDRMSEVLGNLLSNAFKFTDRGGTVELLVHPAGEDVAIHVRDTGAGIPPEQLPHIFQKFFQADNQQSAAITGTGLGLAIAKQIVEAHGGTIEVESTPGVGTTFTITLPASVTVARPVRSSGPVPVIGAARGS